MLKGRHRHEAPAAPNRRLNSTRTSVVAPAEVGLIPGNRFFLLPLRKVTALVRPHTPCREPSATSTKPCIVTKATKSAAIHGGSNKPAQQQCYVRSQAHSRRFIGKQRHRRSLVAKTRLSPVSEQAHAAEQELLLEQEISLPNWLWSDLKLNFANGDVDRSSRALTNPATNCNWLQHRSRSRDTSIFTLRERPQDESCRGAQASSPQVRRDLDLSTARKKKKKLSSSFYNIYDTDSLRYRSSCRKTLTKSRFSAERGPGRSFGRSNRVSPSSQVQQLHPDDNSVTSFGASDRVDRPAWNSKSRSSSNSYRGEVGCSAAVSHQIRSSSPFLCSFTHKSDLPVGPLPQLRRLPPTEALPEIKLM